MRRLTLLLLVVLLCPLLAGCQVTGELENQAYVLALGIDRSGDGDIALTARVPKVGKGTDAKEKGADGDSPYLTFAAEGRSWPQALEALQRATPREMNLSHIELLVVSEDLARSDAFPALLPRIAETPHLYATARFAVCRGDARSFVGAEQAVIGTRLSAEIKAMLKHYAIQGYIPDSSLAEVYYATNSIYSDPVAICCRMEPEDASDGDVGTPTKQRFEGTAVFARGRLAQVLDVDETRLVTLLRGSAKVMPVECGGETYELTPMGRPALCAAIDGGAAHLEINLRLAAPDDACDADIAALERALTRDIAALVSDCQRRGIDPFGFAEAAAGRFMTVPDWLAADWRGLYGSASLAVDVKIRGAA